jgi:hypothetical protein
MSFQNCGTYSPAESDADLSSIKACTGSECLISEEGILIEVRTTNMKMDSSRNFDVAGFCDPGGYENNRLAYSVNNGGTVVVPEQIAGAQCDELGRFHFVASTPNVPAVGQSYSVNIRLQAYDGTQWIDNPLGGNSQTAYVSQ